MVAAVVVAVLVVSVLVAVVLSGAGQGGSGAAVGPTGSAAAGSAPAPADVAAARACQAFAVYLADARAGEVPAATGRTLVAAAAVLLQGAQEDQKAGRAPPRWAALGADLLAAADDVVSHRSEALSSDGAAAGASCQTIPATAAKAGGFVRATG